MRTTIDIPDETYRAIKVMAAERGGTVRELVLEGLAMVTRINQTAHKRIELPVIRSAQPGSPEIDEETIDDIIGFP